VFYRSGLYLVKTHKEPGALKLQFKIYLKFGFDFDFDFVCFQTLKRGPTDYLGDSMT
jgi:hypothetical protein